MSQTIGNYILSRLRNRKPKREKMYKYNNVCINTDGTIQVNDKLYYNGKLLKPGSKEYTIAKDKLNKGMSELDKGMKQLNESMKVFDDPRFPFI